MVEAAVAAGTQVCGGAGDCFLGVCGELGFVDVDRVDDGAGVVEFDRGDLGEYGDGVYAAFEAKGKRVEWEYAAVERM